MEIIVNNKTFSNGLNIIQLETAVGAAMKSFEGSVGKFEKAFSLFLSKKVILYFPKNCDFVPTSILQIIRV